MRYFCFMKALAPYFFTFLYLVAMFRPVAPVIEYIINEDYIAEFLCINKDRPELKCNGKCYLMQMLREQQDEEQHHLPGIAMEKYPIGFVTFVLLEPVPASHMASSLVIDYLNTYSFLYSAFSFHPPSTDISLTV